MRLKKGSTNSMRSKYYKPTEEAISRFKTYLRDKDISMSEFARRMGVSKQYLSKILQGCYHITPRIRELFKKGGYEII